jgi:acyl-coenzyme A synthetase/AMP-(fatty) acid ligase
MSAFAEMHARSLRDPQGFWADAADDVHWMRRWDTVLDDSRPPFYRWFAGGVLNTCYNALDLHVERGHGNQRALIYDSPVTGTVRVFTYAELRDRVARLAGALVNQGIGSGDRVVIYKPMVPATGRAMLACTRSGASHSVVFGGFASNELAKRIDDARPKLILSASCGIEVNRVVPYKPLLDAAIGMATHLGMLPVKPGSPTKAVPGYDVRIFDDDGHEAPAGQIGNVVIKLPLPPGCFPTLWNNDEGFKQSYLTRFPGYYQTSDAGFRDKDDYLFIMGRTDDIINVAGHRLSTGGIEEVLAGHPDVAECAVIAAPDELKGEVPVGFVVLKAGVTRTPGVIVQELIQRVRDSIGPVACFRSATVVARLPKTRSGKILRGSMKRMADGSEVTAPSTIDDPAILDEIRDALRDLGYPKAPTTG